MQRIPDFRLIAESNTGTDFDHDIPKAQRKTILTVGASSCHWPIGDPQGPGFFLCGAQHDGKSSYCKHHAQVAYRTIGPSPVRWKVA